MKVLKLNKIIGISLLLHSLFALVLVLLGLSVWNVGFYVAGVLIGIALLIGDEEIFQSWYQLDRPFSTTFLFLLVYVPLLLFVLTSSGSYFASGMLLAIGVYKVASYIFILMKSQILQVPEDILAGGKEPITRLELQYITGILLFLLGILAVRMIL